MLNLPYLVYSFLKYKNIKCKYSSFFHRSSWNIQNINCKSSSFSKEAVWDDWLCVRTVCNTFMLDTLIFRPTWVQAVFDYKLFISCTRNIVRLFVRMLWVCKTLVQYILSSVSLWLSLYCQLTFTQYFRVCVSAYPFLFDDYENICTSSWFPM